MVPYAALNPHVEVFQAVRAHLIEQGFAYSTWASYAHVVPEIPRPALFPAGDFREIDLAGQTANFPHDLSLEPMAAYAALLSALWRERGGPRGRPITNCWREYAPEARTSVQSIMTPMRSGYYGIERGKLGAAYHVAEFVYLLHRTYPGYECVIDDDDRDFYIVIDDQPIGVVGGSIIDTRGDEAPIEHPFDFAQLYLLRSVPGLVMANRATLWRSIHAFVLKVGLDADPAFMQALAHARWSLPGVLEWNDRPYLPKARGRPRAAQRTPAQSKALRVEEAFEILKQLPGVDMRSIRQRLVPDVISRERWREDLTPLTRSRHLKRKEVISYLQHLHRELLAQA